MKIKIGDKVKFLNAVGGGKVIRITGEGLVFVEDEDGFEIPVIISELVKISEEPEVEIPEKTNLKITKDQDIEAELEHLFNEMPKQIITGNEKPGSYLALFPQYQGASFIYAFDLYLINNSNYKILYTAGMLKNTGEIIHIDAGLLDANSKVCLHTINHKDLNDPVNFWIQNMFYQPKHYSLQVPIFNTINIDPLLILDPNELTSNEFFTEKVILFRLQNEDVNIRNKISEKEVLKAIAEKEKQDDTIKKPLSTEVREVDLHIEEIIEDHSQLGKAEILDIQMSRFKYVLETAIRNKEKKVVFIHGTGEGKLRYEIRKYIDNNYPRFKYQDASFKEYGYGATLVILK